MRSEPALPLLRARHSVAAVAALLLLLSLLLAGTPHARATAGEGVLRPGETLMPGQSLVSPNGRYTAENSGGGLAVRRDGTVIWRNGRLVPYGAGLVMQGDGNLVLYSEGGTPLWHTWTYGRGPAELRMQDDGNLVLYNRSTWQPLWWTGVGPNVSVRGAGSGLGPGQSMFSQDGRTELAMQTDGNLVLYRYGMAMWSTRTRGAGNTMYVEGRFVAVSAPSGQILWTSSWGYSGTLVLQNDANLVFYAPGAVWHSGTWQPDCSAVTGSIPYSQTTTGANGAVFASCYTPAWNRMVADARAQGVTLTPNSSWRDTNKQIQLRIQNCGGNTYYNIWQKPAQQCNPATAIPGRSNHEWGLAVDLANSGTRSTTVHRWMAANGPKYGFFNYPPEPWHWSIDAQ